MMDNTVERCAGKFDYNFRSNSNKNDAKKLPNFQLSRADWAYNKNDKWVDLN